MGAVGEMKMTRYFKLSEFACRCGCGLEEVDTKLISSLELMREVYARPIRITSGVRCPAHNRAVGGAPTSVHLEGLAADLAVRDSLERYLLVDLAIAAGFRRIGVAKSFIHIDLSPRAPAPRLWVY
jgi:uncharacterized protein YcbK (DUF882 family)